MQRWDRLLDGYIEEYSSRGLAEGTVKKVYRELDRWGGWMKQRRPKPKLEEVDVDLLTRYISARTHFRSKATTYGTLSVMRGMGDYLVREGIWSSNALRWMRGPKLNPYSNLPKRINQQQMQKMWKEAACSRGRYRKHLWVTVLGLLYGTGLRRGELERLDLGSWDRESGVLLIDGRKTGRQRKVPVPEVVYRCMEAFMPERQNHLEKIGRLNQPALLINRFGERLRGDYISRGVHGVARGCGVDLHSLHQFRHTCASDLLESGVRLPEVQKILGHQAITTTVRYLHIADPQRHEAMELHPINDWLAAEAA